MKKVKTVNFMDLTDETLLNLFKFNAYDCDEVVFNYNMDIDRFEINKCILRLNKIFNEYLILLCDDYEDDYLIYDSNKHDLKWIKLDYEENTNHITSITHDYRVLEIITLLTKILLDDDIEIAFLERFDSFIFNKFEKTKTIRDMMSDEVKQKYKVSYFNYDYEVLVNKYSQGILVEAVYF